MKVDTYRRIGELLVARGVITERQLAIALAEHRAGHRRLGDALVDRGFADEAAIAKCLAEQYSHPYIDIKTAPVDQEAAQTLTPDDAVRMNALPFARTEYGLAVAIADPVDVPATDALYALLRTRLELHVAPSGQLASRIRATYGLSDEGPEQAAPEAKKAPKRFSQLSTQYRFESTVVFNAYDGQLDRKVCLSCRPTTSPDAADCTEITRAAASIAHPSIVSIFDMFDDRDYFWTVMPTLPADNLDRIIKVRGPRKVAEAARWVADLAEALDELGQTGRTQAWACPQNVCLGSRGPLLVPLVSPPDSYCGTGMDTASAASAYALSRLLKECLYGPDSKGHAQVPLQMQEIVATGLDAVPAKRFGSAIELASALKSFNWGAIERGGDTTMAERAQLLHAIDGGFEGSGSRKASFWDRLMGREVA